MQLPLTHQYRLEVRTQTLTSTYHCHAHDLCEGVGGTSLDGLTQTLTSTYHGHAHDLCEGVGGTPLGGLTEPGVGTVEGRLVTCIDDITERQ